MTDLDLEAIKARALAATPGPWEAKDNGEIVCTAPGVLKDHVWVVTADEFSPVDDNTAAHIAGMDPTTTLALIERTERLQDAWSEAVTSGEWATFQLEEARDRLKITDETIERAALAIAEVDEWPTNEELSGGPTGTRDEEFRDQHIDMARAALEAALGEGKGE